MTPPPLASSGAFANFGSITAIGTTFPNRKGGNFEGGTAVTIANSVAGGFFNAGPSTSNGTTPTASISGNGDIAQTSSGTVFSPTVLIDPSQSVTVSQGIVRGPAILGPVLTSIDSVDGGKGYAFINHGSITGVPTDLDISALTVAIQGSSAANFTCLSGSSTACTGVPATPGTLATTGGLLNTGTISAQALTKEDTTSNVSAEAMLVGAFATVPRIDVAGEFVSGSNFTSGNISAIVAGPGGGIANGIADRRSGQSCPQIDVLQHGSIIGHGPDHDLVARFRQRHAGIALFAECHRHRRSVRHAQADQQCRFDSGQDHAADARRQRHGGQHHPGDQFAGRYLGSHHDQQ